MKFLAESECEQWCEKRGLLLPEPLHERRPPSNYVCHEFRIPEDAGARVALCRVLWSVPGEWMQGQRLVWIKDWSVWPSGEHMLLYTKWRAASGERRPLIQAPGHVIEPSEEADGLSILVVAALFLWDCWMYTETSEVALISHDEWGFVLQRAGRDQSNVRAALKAVGALTS